MISTFAPFDSVHSVASMPAIARVLTMRPGVGLVATSGAPAAASTYAVIDVVCTCVNTRSNSALDGTATPSFCGAAARITRFCPASHDCAKAFTSASVMPASRCCTSGRRCSMPSTGSPVNRKSAYRSAKVPDAVLSRSAYWSSKERTSEVFARSNSVAVNPNCRTRSASVITAPSPETNAPSATSALSWNDAAARTRLP